MTEKGRAERRGGKGGKGRNGKEHLSPSSHFYVLKMNFRVSCVLTIDREKSLHVGKQHKELLHVTNRQEGETACKKPTREYSTC